MQSRGPAAVGFPACLLAGGEGDVGEKGEGTECYLLVPRIGSGAACGGGAMERDGDGCSVSPAAARRRGLEGAARFGGFGRRWESCWGALFGREMAGEVAPRSSGSGGGEWRRRRRFGRSGRPGPRRGASGGGEGAVSGVGLDGGGLEKGARRWSSGGSHGGPGPTRQVAGVADWRLREVE